MTSFTLDGAGPLAAVPDLLGLWSTPRGPGESLSFETAAVPLDETLVWRVNLPADVQQANMELMDGQARARAGARRAGEATNRIASLIQPASRNTSFAIAVPGSTIPEPEAELLNSLRELNRPVSFGLGLPIGGAWQEGVLAFESAIHRVEQFILRYARVDTAIEGQLVASTMLGLTGSMSTAFRNPANAGAFDLHRQTLVVVLESRTALIRTFAVAVRGAVILASLPALAANPVAALLALPAAWKYVNRVAAELI